jgi:hypothetical protein
MMTGKWGRGDVVGRWVESGRKIVPEVEGKIEEAWGRASARLGEKLFDGPMCRLEKWEAGERLVMELSRTSYKPFLGTNLENAELADRYGAEVLASAVGLSAALETSDGWVLFGKRNDSVAYYPGRVHPFAGALEGLDVFEEMMRELDEELGLGEQDVAEIWCVGMVEDLKLRQPELVFWVKSTRTRGELEARLDATEHRGVVAVACERSAIAQAMEDPEFTPVAVGTLAVWSGMNRGGRR